MRQVKTEDSVWRYMTFGRFVWMLSRRRLWLARTDTLSDPWELSVSVAQLHEIVATAPIRTVADDIEGKPYEAPEARAEQIIKDLKRSTYVSCWRASESESHALWKIYCGSPEGVAVRTTFGKLIGSVQGLEVRPVDYAAKPRSLSPIHLASTKRMVYEYENEVRVISSHKRGARAARNSDHVDGAELLHWDAEENIDAVFVHPDADEQFILTVRAVVAQFAPRLEPSVQWSSMRTKPAF